MYNSITAVFLVTCSTVLQQYSWSRVQQYYSSILGHVFNGITAVFLVMYTTVSQQLVVCSSKNVMKHYIWLLKVKVMFWDRIVIKGLDSDENPKSKFWTGTSWIAPLSVLTQHQLQLITGGKVYVCQRQHLWQPKAQQNLSLCKVWNILVSQQPQNAVVWEWDGEWEKQDGSMTEESQVSGCYKYNITFIKFTPTRKQCRLSPESDAQATAHMKRQPDSAGTLGERGWAGPVHKF